MITNLLNTLMLSASVSLGATNNFNNELKPNQANTNTQVAYTETTTNTNYQILKGLNFSHTNEDETVYKIYTLNRRSDTSNTTSTPNNFLVINQYTQIYQNVDSNNNGYIDTTTKDNIEINTLKRYTENELFKYPATMYIKLEITPTDANSNVRLTYDSSIRVDPSQTEETLPSDTEIGWKSLIYTTTKQLENDNNWYCVDRIQNEQYYTGKLIKNLQNLGTYRNGQILTGVYNTIDIDIISNTRNYVYLWFQPTFIFSEENQLTRKGIKTTNLAITTENPQSIGEWINTTQNIITRTQIKGINTPIGTYEVVDIGGLTFTILGLPFTFISTAFNLTLFPGTPYQVNISTLFLSVFAVIVFVFIVKLILGAIGNK